MWSQMPFEDGLTGSSDSTGSGQESHTSQVVAATPPLQAVRLPLTRLPANWWLAVSNLRRAKRVPNTATLVERRSDSAATQAQPLRVQGRLDEGPSRWLMQDAAPRGVPRCRVLQGKDLPII